MCHLIKDRFYIRDECFTEMAKQKNDYKLCLEISTGRDGAFTQEKNSCLQNIALNTKNIDICDQKW